MADGGVTVVAETVADPARDVGESDEVRVDGRRISAEPTETWILNKPAGVVSTAREPGSRQAVTDLAESDARLHPAGPLDGESTRVILLSNDGQLTKRRTHPRYEVPTAYLVQLPRPSA